MEVASTELRGDENVIVDILIFAGSFGLVGLLVYLLLRFGPVDHSWVKLDKEEIRRLKDDHKRHKQTSLPTRPIGKPLYKRKMISHDGLAIYGNGLYAKFCVGRKGKYRFVPFTEISDIYSVKMENPFTRVDSVLMGLSSWKALQIETTSRMVFIVDSRKHDFGMLTPILKKAMGGMWDRAYHLDEVLWGNMLEGDIMIHKSIRSQRIGYVQPKAPSARPAPAVPTEGKGTLLLEESQEDLEKRKKSFTKGALVLIAFGVGLVGVGIAVVLLDAFFFFFPLFTLVMGFLVLALGIILLIVRNRLKPLRIYDNGFEAPLLLPNRTIFISFGEIVKTSSRRNFIDGEIYVYETGKPNEMVGIRKDMKGFDQIKEYIRSKIGRAEHIVRPEYSPEDEIASRKKEYLLYAVGLLIGVLLSLFFTYFLFRGMSLGVILWGLAFILPPLTTITITMVTYYAKRLEKILRLPRKLNIKIPATIVVVLLVVSIMTMSLGFVTSNIDFLPQESPEYIESRPESSYLAQGTYYNESFTVNDHILVDSGQTLHIENSTILMNMTRDRQLHIWVAEGGTLILENTTLESSSPAYGYTFEIMGTASIAGSSISHVWGDLNINDDGGVEIYSDYVIVDRTLIKDGRANGILIKNSSPVVTNTTIRDITQDGIETRNSAALIMNNTIERCGWAMIISHKSETRIIGNAISHNEFGIWIGASSPTIENNEFDHNDHYAIHSEDDSNPTIEGNTYWMNERNVVREPPSYTPEICSITTVIIAVVCLLTLFHVYKQGLQEESKVED
jgi:parallel beta-helix repeat protein